VPTGQQVRLKPPFKRVLRKHFQHSPVGCQFPAIGIFGQEGAGKTRFCATAEEYARERGKTPGWLVCDRKSRKTVRDVYQELGYDLPFIQKEDFIAQDAALEIALLDRESEKDNLKIQRIYTEVYQRLVRAAIELAKSPDIEPIIFETGTQIWDWISFSHFGKKQGVGKSRVWGPPKQDWSDLMDGLSHKVTLISFWERDAYKGEERAGFTKPDGPPHLGFTTTSLVRLNIDQKKKLTKDESYVDRFSLDIYESQDNVGLAGVNDVLSGESITYANLMAQLRPED